MGNFGRCVWRCAKILLKVLFWAVVLPWLCIRVLIASYYTDVTTCFEDGTPTDTVRFVTIHHDAIPQGDEVSLRDIDKFHADVRKWSCGMAYNYYLAPDHAYKIRPDKNKGAHTYNNNSYNVGICLHGDFQNTEDRPTLTQQISLILLTNVIVIKYQISLKNVKRHKDWDNQSGTSCCGRNLDFDKFKNYIIDVDKHPRLTNFLRLWLKN